MKTLNHYKICVYCARRFKAFSLAGKPNYPSVLRRLTDPHGYFCTLRCAAHYGVAAVNKSLKGE